MTKKIQSLYLHFPFCKHLCNYCDFYKKVPSNRPEELESFHQYMEAAFLEHERLRETNGYSWAPLKTLYIGGGTPSLWGQEGSHFLAKLLAKYSITLAPDCEFTLEVNPASWTAEILASWEEIGVNRYSLGIQSLNGQAIKYLDRIHSIEDVYETLEFFKNKKVNYSMDFMLGLPFSKDYGRDVIEELKRALEFNPSHFSVYILTVKNNYVHFDGLPTEEWVEKEFLDVAEFLKNNGFEHYEVSNFARPGLESKHNLNYWKSETVAAVGPSATGFLAENRVRYKWKTKDANLEIENLDEDAARLEKAYMSMRSSVGLDLQIFAGKEVLAEAVVSKWEDDGLAKFDSKHHVHLTSKGYLLLDSLMNDLFSFKLL